MVRLGRLWSSTLCLMTMSGLLTVGAVPLPKGLNVGQLSSSQMAFFIPVEIINHQFTAALLNSETKEFNDMYKDVCTLFNGVYNCSDCVTKRFYGGIATMTFSPGSVIANAIVLFDSYAINPFVASSLFQRYAEKAAPPNLQLNMAYTSWDKIESVQVHEPTTPTTPTTTATTPTTYPSSSACLSVELLSSTSQRVFLIPIEITNHQFTAAMLYPETQEYKDMYSYVCTLFNRVYNCSDCPTKTFYGGVATMIFSPGPLITNAVVVFNAPSMNNIIAWALFQINAPKAAENLQLNMAYTTLDNVEQVDHID